MTPLYDLLTAVWIRLSVAGIVLWLVGAFVSEWLMMVGVMAWIGGSLAFLLLRWCAIIVDGVREYRASR